MTATNLSSFNDLRKQLQEQPRHLMTAFCREHGFQSWHCNAEQNPKYSEFKERSKVSLLRH